MKALVSCDRHLLLVDLPTHQTAIVEDSRPGYYGISWTTDGQKLCLGHCWLVDTNTIEEYMDSERSWVSLGNRSSLPVLSAPHQILCTDQHILVANSGRNCITIFRQEDLFYQNHWVEDQRWDRKGADVLAGSHYNSVYVRNGRLYVVAHNFNRGSYLLVFSWPGMELIEKLPMAAIGAHNVWAMDDGRILVCDSMRGTLIEARSGDVLWSARCKDSMGRGLASDGKILLVGESLQTSRFNRAYASGGIYVVEMETWKTLDYFSFPRMGNVREVRLLDVPDLCHHGNIFRAPIQADPGAQERFVVRHRLLDELHGEREARTLGWNICLGRVKEAFGRRVSLVEQELSIVAKSDFRGRDVTVQARLTMPPATKPQHAGVIARYCGPGESNQYVALINAAAEGQWAEIWRNLSGTWTRLSHAALRSSAGPWDLKFSLRGGQLQFHVDNTLVIEVEDPAPLGDGAVGVRGVIGTFDDFQASALT